MFWKTLHTQLAEAVGVEGGGGGGRGKIVMGRACVDVSPVLPEEGGGGGGGGGRVRLTFDDGSTVRAQCVLAADGVHSSE